MYFKCTYPDGHVEYRDLTDEQLYVIIDSDKIESEFDCNDNWTIGLPIYDNFIEIDVRDYLKYSPQITIDGQKVKVEEISEDYELLVAQIGCENPKEAFCKTIFFDEIERYETNRYYDHYSDDPPDSDEPNHY